jgi:CRISPR-associated protein Csd2
VAQFKSRFRVRWIRSLQLNTITRQAFTGEKDIKSGIGTFGRKYTVAYGLYCAYGFINPVFAKQTGFSEEDLQLLWRAFENMFEIDRSASRGLMAPRNLFAFKHNSALGDAPAHRLFDLVSPRLRDGIASPRKYTDYDVHPVDKSRLPNGVRLLTPFDASPSAKL